MLQPLRDSSPKLRAGNFASLNRALQDQGYIFLRGALNKEQVAAARLKVLEHLDGQGGVLDPAADSREGVLVEGCGQGCIPFLEGRNAVTHCPEVLTVFEGDDIRSIFSGLFSAAEESGNEEEAGHAAKKAKRMPPRTFDFKWLRAVRLPPRLPSFLPHSQLPLLSEPHNPLFIP
jgi:hypothetical protein